MPRLASAHGATVSIPPLAVGSVVDETPGVRRSQLVQTGPSTVLLRLEVKPGAQPERVWEAALANLGRYLTDQGVTEVRLVRAVEAPERSATSGKFRQVIAG